MLARRIRQLESARGAGRCTHCGGKGLLVVSYRNDDEPVPEAKGCPYCGEVCHVVISFTDESLPGQPRKGIGPRLTGAELGALYD